MEQGVIMQFVGATNLELRISECIYRCETELPASELETDIVTCLSDASNELQRLRGIIEDIKDALISSTLNSGERQVPNWAFASKIVHFADNRYRVRWTNDEGDYYWLNENNTWDSQKDIDIIGLKMHSFSNYASAQLAVNASSEPPRYN